CLQDQGVPAITPCYSRFRVARLDLPVTVIMLSEQRREASVGIKAGPAQPVEGTMARDKRRPIAVTDQRIVFDERRHGGLLREVYDNLDVARTAFERLAPVRQGDAASDQPSEPALVGAREGVRGQFVMT